jgi:hypothetical protein
MRLVIPYLKRMERMFSTPYNWNIKERKFVLIGDKRYVKTFLRVLFLTISNFGIVCWNTLYMLFHENNNLLVMWGLFITAVTFTITVSQLVHYVSGKKIAELQNRCLTFHHFESQPGKCFCSYSSVTGVITVFI